MSKFPLTAAGAVDAVDNGTVAYIHGGLAFTSAGKLCVTTTNAQFEVHNGFSLDSMGRIRIVAGGTVSEIHNGFALDSQGRLVVTETDPGIAFLHSGRRRGAAGLFLTGGGVSGPVLTGLAAWYDASDLVLTNGDPVASWPDKSGNGRTLTQATAAQRPTYAAAGVGGKPSVNFDGSDDSMFVALTLAQPLTIITCAGSNLRTGQRQLVDGFGAAGSRPVVYQGNTGNWELFATAGVNSGIATTAAAQIVAGTFDNTARPVYVNGAAGASVNPGNAAIAALTIGKDGNAAANFWPGPIPEVLIYNRVLSDAERKDVEQYLMKKYSINPVTSGLAAWYDATDLALANGAAVASWPDKSGNGRTLTQATAAAQPTMVTSGIGGRPTVRGDGVDDSLRFDAGGTTFITGNYTLFTVAKPNGPVVPGFRRMVSAASPTEVDAAAAGFLTFRQTDEQVRFFAGAAERLQLPRIQNEALIAAFTYNGTGATGFKNGSAASPSTFTATPNVSRLGLFANAQAGGENDNVDIAEVLLYNRALSDAERKQVEKYLSDKYTITVAP